MKYLDANKHFFTSARTRPSVNQGPEPDTFNEVSKTPRAVWSRQITQVDISPAEGMSKNENDLSV